MNVNARKCGFCGKIHVDGEPIGFSETPFKPCPEREISFPDESPILINREEELELIAELRSRLFAGSKKNEND